MKIRKNIMFPALLGLLTAACASRSTPLAAPAWSSSQATASAAPSVEERPTAVASLVQAQEFPDSDRYQWVKVADGLESPVDIQFPPDGSGRMFIVEQPGRVRIVDASGLSAKPFLDITDRVNSAGNEQGLLGLAFDPRFSETGRFLVNYTDQRHHNVIARFVVSADAHQADPSSEAVLISIDDPFPNHNGGVLAFGPDGLLYAGLGDGGGAGDPFGNAQNPNSALGKILRIDVDGGDLFTIPAGNAFAQGGGNQWVWALGLRNPWRFSFDKATGDLYIADVGQNTWEEIDFLGAGTEAGANLGWNYREGKHAFAGSAPAGAQLIDPIYEYSHSEGGCSITGGYVYRGRMPEWMGLYLYGDYCSGRIWGLLNTQAAGFGSTWTSKLLFETRFSITTFGQDPGGEVYLGDRAGGIYRLEPKP